MTDIVNTYLKLSLSVILMFIGVFSLEVITKTPSLNNDNAIFMPLVLQEFWNPSEGDEFYIGQRSGSMCAEHDSYIVPIVTAIDNNIVEIDTGITSQYRIRATHPFTEVHPAGAPWYEWCNADWENCPSTQNIKSDHTTCVSHRSSLDTITKIFDNVKEQIYVLDGAPDIGTFDVVVNGQYHGKHSGVIFGSRWGTADSWNHDGVIYANGFTRWKPKGEEPGAETDPCFGTSVVLGPFQIDVPFLSDGYSPNPLRHPTIEEISITVGTGWEAQMTGALFSNDQRMMDISWHAERQNIDPTEMLVSINQYAVAIQDLPLYQILGRFGIGQVELSSMFADINKHDSDTQIGSNAEIWVGDISNSNQGLWGQENILHPLPEGSTVCLETKMPTTHNTGSPTLCILWDLGQIP
ncbi:MAG TPA: hypothetical protein VLA49_08210 [Anaerolineales bacterium]|nr:hypothetical protein [Anaerolineales bacterium]